MNRVKALVAIIGIGLFGVFATGIVIWRHNSSFDASITIQVVPTDSRVTMDGKSIKAGTWRVKSGNHNVLFSREGFSSVTKNIVVTKSQNNYMGVALIPTDPSFANWYTDHPKDRKLAESISSQAFDSVNSQSSPIDALVTDLPYINLLPYFRIDFGVSKKNPNDPTKSAIYIRFNDSESKQEALDWITSRGVNVNDLEIIYPSQ